MGYPHIRGTVVAAEWQPSFTYGRASDALTFCVLLRIPRLRPPSLPSNILMPTAVSLWAFLRPLGSLAAVALLCSEICIQQISEYGGTKNV